MALRILLASLLLTLMAACGSRTAKPSSAKLQGHILTLTDSLLNSGGSDTLRLGNLRSGEQVVLPFWIINRTSHPVVLEGYDRTCGCTALEFEPSPVKTGESRQISLTFDSRGEWGWQLKTLDLSFTGSRRPLRLFVEAEVK